MPDSPSEPAVAAAPVDAAAALTEPAAGAAPAAADPPALVTPTLEEQVTAARTAGARDKDLDDVLILVRAKHADRVTALLRLASLS